MSVGKPALWGGSRTGTTTAPQRLSPARKPPIPAGLGSAAGCPENTHLAVLGMGPQDTSPRCEGQENGNSSGERTRERTTGWKPSLSSFPSFLYSPLLKQKAAVVCCRTKCFPSGSAPRQERFSGCASPGLGVGPWGRGWCPSRRGCRRAGIPGAGHGHMDLPKGQSCSETDPHPIKVSRK